MALLTRLIEQNRSCDEEGKDGEDDQAAQERRRQQERLLRRATLRRDRRRRHLALRRFVEARTCKRQLTAQTSIRLFT